MTSRLDKYLEASASIQRGEFDEWLRLLAGKIEQRQDIVGGNKSISDFSIGDKVIVNNLCGTKYVVGEMATVIKKKRTNLIITFDEPKGRFIRKNADGSIRSSETTIAITLVDKITV